MKQCPQCRKTYTDDNQFCQDDGTTLQTDFVSTQQTSASFPHPLLKQVPNDLSGKWIYPILGLLSGLVIVFGFLAFYPRNSNEIVETASIKEIKNETAKPEEILSQNQPINASQSPILPNQSTFNSSVGRFPEASTRYLTGNDIYGKSDWDLRIMRNEIFARHGYIFKNVELRNHFLNQTWYSPRYEDVSRFLSAVEKKNAALLKSYE